MFLQSNQNTASRSFFLGLCDTWLGTHQISQHISQHTWQVAGCYEHTHMDYTHWSNCEWWKRIVGCVRNEQRLIAKNGLGVGVLTWKIMNNINHWDHRSPYESDCDLSYSSYLSLFSSSSIIVIINALSTLSSHIYKACFIRYSLILAYFMPPDTLPEMRQEKIWKFSAPMINPSYATLTRCYRSQQHNIRQHVAHHTLQSCRLLWEQEHILVSLK